MSCQPMESKTLTQGAIGGRMSVSPPLCTWPLATCYSKTLAGNLESDSPNTSGVRLSSSRRRYSSRVAALQHQLGSIATPLEHLSLSFEACPEHRGNATKYWSWEDHICQQLQQHKRRTSTSCKAFATAGELAKDSEPPARKYTSTKQRRVVVTGMGLVSSLGDDPDKFYQSLLQGKSGISQIESFDCHGFPTRIAGEIKAFSPDGWVAPKFSRRMDKFMLYSICAAKKAVGDAGIDARAMPELDKTRCGVIMGSSLGGMQVFYDANEALVSKKKLSSYCVPFALISMPAALLAIDLGWMGANYGAGPMSNTCILNAANGIIRGEADVMVVGGSDAAINPIGLSGFIACKALSQRNDEPSKASRPWDRDRDGAVLGEGAGALVLEELEHAKKRGAKIYAEFLGGSSSCDAFHVTSTHPEGKGMLLCIEKALERSGVRPQDVNYVNADAASTKPGDVNEYKAIMHWFAQNSELKVNSSKSMTGHLLGAAGALDAITTIQAISTGWLHPNINIDNPEEGVDMDVLVGGEKERLRVKVALSNSFGFGGQNSSILFAPYDKR